MEKPAKAAAKKVGKTRKEKTPNENDDQETTSETNGVTTNETDLTTVLKFLDEKFDRLEQTLATLATQLSSHPPAPPTAPADQAIRTILYKGKAKIQKSLRNNMSADMPFKNGLAEEIIADYYLGSPFDPIVEASVKTKVTSMWRERKRYLKNRVIDYCEKEYPTNTLRNTVLSNLDEVIPSILKFVSNNAITSPFTQDEYDHTKIFAKEILEELNEGLVRKKKSPSKRKSTNSDLQEQQEEIIDQGEQEGERAEEELETDEALSLKRKRVAELLTESANKSGEGVVNPTPPKKGRGSPKK